MSAHDDAVMQLEALQSLISHPGWHIIADQIKRTADSEFSKMRNAAVQDELLRHTYTYMALLDLLKVPELLMKPLVMQLQLTKKP